MPESGCLSTDRFTRTINCFHTKQTSDISLEGTHIFGCKLGEEKSLSASESFHSTGGTMDAAMDESQVHLSTARRLRWDKMFASIW
jgi:hypothetical protein